MSSIRGLPLSVKQVARTWYGMIIGLAVLGAVGGLVVFAVSLIGGWPRFTAIGAMAGIAFGGMLVVLFRFRARFQLTRVSVSVLGQEAEFAINAQYRKAAWRLFVETMTRVATQPLDPSTGKTKEALASLYSLFETTRQLLKEIEPTPTTEGRTVEGLAIEMLNRHIRPFLAKWHPVISTGAEGVAIERADDQQCRAELELLRSEIVEYARAFGQLAGVLQLDEFFEH